ARQPLQRLAVVPACQQGGQIGARARQQQLGFGGRELQVAPGRLGRPAGPAQGRDMLQGGIEQALFGLVGPVGRGVGRFAHGLTLNLARGAVAAWTSAKRSAISRASRTRRLQVPGAIPLTARRAPAELPVTTGEVRLVQIFVRDNNVDQALKALKKKMQREGSCREPTRQVAYAKPPEERARQKAEAARRASKLARKRAPRAGLIPMATKPAGR